MKLTNTAIAELLFRVAVDHQYNGQWPRPAWHQANKSQKEMFMKMAGNVRHHIAQSVLGREIPKWRDEKPAKVKPGRKKK